MNWVKDSGAFLATKYLQLYSVLKQTDGLHLRWATETPYEGIAPFVARVSPGLHVFFKARGKGPT